MLRALIHNYSVGFSGFQVFRKHTSKIHQSRCNHQCSCTSFRRQRHHTRAQQKHSQWWSNNNPRPHHRMGRWSLWHTRLRNSSPRSRNYMNMFHGRGRCLHRSILTSSFQSGPYFHHNNMFLDYSRWACNTFGNCHNHQQGINHRWRQNHSNYDTPRHRHHHS